MNNLSKYLVKLDSYFYKTGYIFCELCLAYIYPKRKMKILFSKKETLEKKISFAFRFLPHTVTFADINPETIAAHDLVIPLHIEDIFYLNEVRHLVKDNAIPIPSNECVRLCDDKYIFGQKMIENNFGDYIPQINGELPYPFFFKKKIDISGQHSYLVENREQELELLNSVNSDDYFRQKFVSGKSEYSTHLLFDKQRIVRSITLEYIFLKDGAISGKDNQFAIKMVDGRPYLDLFTAILNSIGYEGICCFNYKLVDNRPCIFEINPRFGGNLSLYFFSFLRSLN